MLTDEQKHFVLRRMDYEGLENVDDYPPQVAYIISKIETITVDEALETLKDAIVEHESDVNLLDADYELWQRLVEADANESDVGMVMSTEKSEGLVERQAEKLEVSSSMETLDDYTVITDWNFQVRLEAALIAWYLPYVQVRACIDPYDEDVPCETARVYVIGILWTAVGAVVNQFFLTRLPLITLPSLVVQVLAYPCGMLCAQVLPNWHIGVGKWRFALNPGPWSKKEQMLATLFYLISGGGTAIANSVIHAQKLDIFYGNKWVDFGYEVLLVLLTQMIGFGLAGIMRKFAIYQVTSMWPSFMNGLALNKALMQPEKKENINGWTISRYDFFFVVFVFAFLYNWIPNYLATFLLVFNWMTWIKPTNLDLVNITGSYKGLGFNPIPTFDPNVINMTYLFMPLQNTVVAYVGKVVGALIIVGMYYSNYKWTAFLPINTLQLFTNEGTRYVVQKVVDRSNRFVQEKYEKYGPPFYLAGGLLAYGAWFIMYPFSFFYETTVHWRLIRRALALMYRAIRSVIAQRLTLSYDGFDDPLCRQMRKYREVPEWWFTIVLLIALAFGIIAIKVYPTGVPVWLIFVSLGLSIVFLVPILAIYSRTGYSFGLTVILEMIIGYAVPGNANALQVAKTYSFSIDDQAESYLSNQKQAHYMRIPPRALFRTQMLGAIVAVFVQLGIMQFQLNGGIADYCDHNNPQKFTCPGIYLNFSALIQWGVIGPKKVFNGLYPVLAYTFLIGFGAVWPCLLIRRWLPVRYRKWFQPTIFVGGMLTWGFNNLLYFTGGLYAGLFFMGYLYRRYNAWWSKYTYLLADGFIAGIALSMIIIYFSVQYHPKPLNWWGNLVSMRGFEKMATGRLNATRSAPDGYFGPRKGNFP